MDAQQPVPAPGAGAVCPGPVVTRRRVQRRDQGEAGGSDAGSSPSSSRPSIRRTVDSLGVRIQTIESAASTESQAEFFKPEQTIIIFDWDDTLCPSTWIQENRRVLSFFKPVPDNEKFQKPLRELQAHAETALRLAMQMGSVVIVTNASDLWVETSCRNFMPQLLPLVRKLPVVYARSLFYGLQEGSPSAAADGSAAALARRPTPGGGSASGRSSSQGAAGTGHGGLGSLALAGLSTANTPLARHRFDELAPQRWKELAFEQEIGGFYSRYSRQSWKNVVSIGDSVFERDALQQVVVNRPCAKKRCRTKTLKLFDDPTIEELTAQVRLLADLLAALVQYDGDLNIEIDADDLREVGVPL